MIHVVGPEDDRGIHEFLHRFPVVRGRLSGDRPSPEFFLQRFFQYGNVTERRIRKLIIIIFSARDHAAGADHIFLRDPADGRSVIPGHIPHFHRGSLTGIIAVLIQDQEELVILKIDVRELAGLPVTAPAVFFIKVHEHHISEYETQLPAVRIRKCPAGIQFNLLRFHVLPGHADDLQIPFIAAFQRQPGSGDPRVCALHMFQRRQGIQRLIRQILIRLFLRLRAVRHECVVFSVYGKRGRPAAFLHLSVHGFLQAQSQRDHDHDGRGADHHSQYGQECPEFPSPKTPQAHPQQIAPPHRTTPPLPGRISSSCAL